jgi:phosphoglycolate phosphatase-like HAD superfamily hydrolase
MAASPRRGVLVDLDGTLVDTNYLHTMAWSRALHDVGEWAPMTAIHHLIGAGGDQLVQRLFGHQIPGVADRRAAHYRPFIDEARPFPGATEALARWRDSGLTVVIASSSPRGELEAMLDLLAAGDIIDGATSADEVDRSKPEPDVLHAALAVGGIEHPHAVVVGDSVWDAAAAQGAGLPFVAVESGGTCERDLQAAGAVAVVHDVSDISAAWLEAVLSEFPGADEHRTGVAQAAANREVDPPV